MRAVLVEQFGGPDVLHPRDVVDPIVGPGDVLVHHEFIGVNYVDAQHRAGDPYPVELPLVVGIEAAGRVVEVGDAVTDVAAGDRIAYGGIMPGVYAEYASVPADHVVHLPDDVPSDVAAAVLVQGWTAHMLTEHLDLLRRAPWADTRAPTAVVFAAAGGTGSLLVQMLSAVGARVLGITSGTRKSEVVASMGAEPIDRQQVDVVTTVREATNGQGADIVFEGIGGPAFEQARLMLRPCGHLVSYGQVAGPVPQIDPAVLSGLTAVDGPGSITLSWPTLNDHNATADRRRERANAVFDMLRDATLSPLVEEILPLSHAAEAHQRLEAGSAIGKLLLDPRS
jgi:NADPH2:quinone reductase